RRPKDRMQEQRATTPRILRPYRATAPVSAGSRSLPRTSTTTSRSDDSQRARKKENNTMHVYLDIETIPGQALDLRDEIAATIMPPGNMKKAETIAAWEQNEKPAAIEEAWRKTAFAGDRGEVVCIAWAVADGPVESVYRTPVNVPDGPNWTLTEADLLSKFFTAVERASKERYNRLPHFIGHNVREFDLR